MTKQATVRRESVYSPTNQIGVRLIEIEALKLRLDQINAEINECKALLLRHANRHEIDSFRLVDHPIAVVRKEKVSWSYSPRVRNLEAQLAKLKQREREEGIALDTSDFYLSVELRNPPVLTANQVGVR